MIKLILLLILASIISKSIQDDQQDLLANLKGTFVNMTYKSIDGQQGDDEREKYYKFIDCVHQYLNFSKEAKNNTNTTGPAFKRHIKTMDFKTAHDPLLSSFMSEFLLDDGRTNPNFEYYEDFLRSTNFGQYYAKNITLIRESVARFDRVYNQLLSINFSSSLTRPSSKYRTIRNLSHELYSIKNDLKQNISTRILANRQDIERMFRKLDNLTKTHPYIHMLGDEYSDDPPKFGMDVSRLTQLLDRYLGNNMTQWFFYDRLAELPEDFIRLGSTIAYQFESTEIPQYTRFDSDFLFTPSTNSTPTIPKKSNSWFSF